MTNWPEFLKAVEKDPKSFAKHIIEHLNPPKYAIKVMKNFEWVCHFCWKPRDDICFNCHRNVCEEHIAKTLIGPKTKLEWYLCPDCLRTDLEAFEARVKEKDEEFWLEDQEEEEE